MIQGLNVKKLIVHKMTLNAVLDGGGIGDAIGFLSDVDKLMKAARGASTFVETAILAVRQAAEPNPWKNATDEEIAGEILRGIEERERK
jgi:hypothetical protein